MKKLKLMLHGWNPQNGGEQTLIQFWYAEGVKAGEKCG
jgi:hypothetical protein